jgi:probable F420-dependent oxidoreductase
MTTDTVMPDPLDWLAFAACATRTVKLATGVLLLPLHSPVLLAKRVATIDVLSGGRMLLGVGLGWQIEEFRAIGVPYAERGRRMDEGIAAMRALWSEAPASYQGSLFGFSRVHCEPRPAAGAVPILVGGSTEPAARRAGRLGDGFFPHAISPDDLALRLETMRAAAQDAGRDPAAIELTVAPWSWNNGARDLGIMRGYAQLGVSRFVLSPFDYGGDDLETMERAIKSFRDDILGRL